MNMAVSPEVPSRVRQLADQLAHAQPMRRGSLSDRTIRCGKSGCACADNPKARHGPYHSLTQAVGGKTRSRFLSEEQAAVARQQSAAGREFRGHVADTALRGVERNDLPWGWTEPECRCARRKSPAAPASSRMAPPKPAKPSSSPRGRLNREMRKA